MNVDVLRLIQKAVSNVQKILSAAGLPPHPELEPELQQEYSKIEPKVKEGTVTKAEAAHLLSLETRAHGHTDKGSLTSVAQSVAARRARKQSVSGSGSQEPRAVQSHNAREENLHKVEMAMLPKIKADPEHVTKEEASLLLRRERQAHGIVEKGSVAAQAQSLADKNINFDHAKDNVAEKHAGEITKDDAALLQSREARVHGNVEAGRATAEVHSLADKNENQAVAAQPPEGIEAFGEGLVRE